MSVLEENKDERSELDTTDLSRIRNFCSIFIILNIIEITIYLIFFNIIDYLIILGISLLSVAPALVANMSMTLTGGEKLGPVDFGKNFFDNKRIFGKGKTWMGLIGGIIIGSIVGIILIPTVHLPITLFADNQYLEYLKGNPDVVNAIKMPGIFSIIFITIKGGMSFSWEILILRAILLSIGAPIGDLVGSFIKRRLNYERGQQLLLIDQLDFIIIALLIALPVYPISFICLIRIILFLPLILVLANIIAYKTGKKSVPW
ncbi:MAG: CDP-archaeol synthase [Candidatus Lokiarchaeota archaeon]|nr:CDP-archaeol synthase [Candidatus Lokiarchaeota archaeon]